MAGPGESECSGVEEPPTFKINFNLPAELPGDELLG